MAEDATTPDDPGARLRLGDAERDQVAEVLRDAAGDGRLTMAELDERLEAAYGAKTYADIAPLTRDLPGAAERVPTAPIPGPAPAGPGTGAPALSLAKPPEPTAGRLPAPRRVVPAPQPLPAARAIAIMGGADRHGPWSVPATVTAVALMGGAEIDLRDAVFTAPVTEITAVAFMGGIEITVPDDVVVHVDGIGIMGGFGRPDPARFRTDLTPDAPVVRIRGLAVWGGVDVGVKAPGSRRSLRERSDHSGHSLH